MKRTQQRSAKRRNREEAGQNSATAVTITTTTAVNTRDTPTIQRLFAGTNITNAQLFFDTLVDKQHLHVARSNNKNGNNASSSPRTRNYYIDTLPVAWSTEHMRTAIRTKQLRHKVDINVVKYDPQLKRRIDWVESVLGLTAEDIIEQHGGEYPLVTVADFDKAIATGWSIRFLRPQEHSAELCQMLFNLEEELQCSCGINSYWTPAGHQGFAPHWDDVDVFLLQLEGQKHWRLYKPASKADVHPRVSSEDFLPDELAQPPLLDTVLRRGELLYMPRGTIHQGDTVHVPKPPEDPREAHSLHVTFSAFQMHTWADLVAATYKHRVEFAAANTVALRQTLPLGWKTSMGSVANSVFMGPYVLPLSDAEKQQRLEIQSKLRAFFTEIHSALMQKDGALDKGVDVVAQGVLERRQPPPELLHGTGATTATTPIVVRDPTKIRLKHRESVRFVMMTDEVRLYHCGGNSVVCLGPREVRGPEKRAVWTDEPELEDQDHLDAETSAAAICAGGVARLDMCFGPAISMLIAQCPAWVPLEKLPCVKFQGEDDDEDETTAAVEDSRRMLDGLLATCCFDIE